ncbi:MAG TPA: thiolase, partial [Acidimicrobiaceae bacterium]|nr:thiolase [Acidimicrobiaceae bacterium]
MIPPGATAIVGAAESTEIGKVPDMSSVGLAIDAAANAMQDAGITAADIDGFTCGYFPVADMSRQLGIFPSWADNTVVGGCSWMFQLRNAIAAIHAGYCNTVLIVYGESGRSTRRLGQSGDAGQKGGTGQQFDMFYSGGQAAATFTLPVLRYQHEYGLSDEDLAVGAVSQREWAVDVPRATLREPTSVDEVLDSPMVAWPIRRAMCCLVSDAGGAIIVTSADRARDYPKPPVYVLG